MSVGNRQDIEIRSGDDVDLVVTVSGQDGLGVIISGVVSGIWWQLGKLATSSNGTPIPAQPGTPLISKALGAASGILISGLSGFVVLLSGSDLNVNPMNRGGDFYHESQLLLSGKRTTTLYGIATVLPDLIEE